MAPQLAYDAKDGYTVLFSGQNASGVGLTDTWTYSNGNWTQIFPTVSPSPRIAGVFVYDAVDQYVVLYGGADPVSSNLLSDTWKFSGGQWTNITPLQGPGPRAEAAATWDAADHSVLVFGGVNDTSPNGANDTWRFAGGTWTELFPAVSPSEREAPAMAYDTSDGYVVMFGGVNLSVNFSDTWRFASGTWTELFPSVSPAARGTWAMEFDPSLGDVVLFGGTTSTDGQFFGDTWTFHGGGWTQQFPVASPSARTFGPMVWDASDGYLLMFGGAFDLYLSGQILYYETWVFAITLSTSFQPPTGPFDTGQSVALSASPTGGIAPYVDNWTFGDGTSRSGSTVSHAYSGPGSFNITLSTTDRFGDLSTVSQSVTIYTRPSVALSASRTTFAAGTSVTLTATPTGGAPSLTFSWTLGDGTTSSQSAPISKSYLTAGTYTVGVTVVDGAHVPASANLTLAVTAVPMTSPSSTSGSTTWLWVGVGLVVVAAVVALIVGLTMRRRRAPPPPPEGVIAGAPVNRPPT